MRSKLTLRLVNSIEVDPARDTLVWDRDLAGFGLRVSRGGVKSYVVQYKAPDGRDRRLTLGKHGSALTLDQARKLAAKRLLEVKIDRDPAEERRAFAAAPTVEDLVKRFLEEHAAKRSAGMQRNCRMLFRLYLLPALGARKVADVRWEDLEKIHAELRDRPYQANRFLAACSKAWALAARWGWWPREMPNPAQGHDRHHEERRGQALDMAGLASLGTALRQEPAESIPAAAFTFMLLTGCRPGEALGARWAAIDLDARIWHLPVTAIRTTRPTRPALWSTLLERGGLQGGAASKRRTRTCPSPAARRSCASRPTRRRPTGWRSMKCDAAATRGRTANRLRALADVELVAQLLAGGRTGGEEALRLAR